MGWNTELFCNITFNKETYNSKNEVLNEIDHIQKCLESAKQDCRNLLLMTEPKKFCPEDDDPICWMTNLYNSNLELIEEYTITLYKLELLLENWDSCHNEEGLAINPPDNITWKTAFLDGDFVNTVKYPNANGV